MYKFLKWIGLAFLIPSLIILMAVAAEVQVPYKVEEFAVSAENPDVEIKEKIVPVPPFNRTLEEAQRLNKSWGWVGFNVSLPHQGKPGYKAGGIILYDPKSPEKSEIIMRVVNETDFEFLILSGMEDLAWNICKIYVEAYLSKNKPYTEFQFNGLDNCPKYCVFFRGLDDGIEDTLILISIKEAWYEYKVWIPRTPLNMTIIGAPAILGLSLTITGFIYNKKSRHLKFRKKAVRR
jgi:hypothetical protein